MKNIIILLTMMLTLTSFSQVSTDSIMATQVSETERIIDKYTAKAVDGFNSVVEKVTPMAEQGFEMAVKLQIAKGIGHLLPIIAFIIFLLLYLKEYNRINNILNSDEVPKNMNSSYGPLYEDNVTPTLVLYFFIVCILFITASVTIYKGIMYLYVPEWFAVKEIIELVK